MRISALLSVYIGTQEEEFEACLQSILSQTMLPSELVVVQDGPVSQALGTALEELEGRCDFNVTTVKLLNNQGLGEALVQGIRCCKFDLVARVDTDDINLLYRFEAQHKVFLESPSLSLVGGQLEEIYCKNGSQKSLIRSVPLALEVIKKTSRYRNPVNHPTVMFRKKDIIEVGSYESMFWFEDYYLWVKLIMAGFTLTNLNIVLVKTYVGSDHFRRRGGTNYLRMEYKFSRKLREIGFQTILQSAGFLATRMVFRVMPDFIRSRLYKYFLRIPSDFK